MNDVYKKEEIRNVAIQDLRNKFGIKYRPKKPKQTQVRLVLILNSRGLTLRFINQGTQKWTKSI